MERGHESLTCRARRLITGLIPSHVRFQRAGRRFLIDGEAEVHELPTLVEPGTVAIDVGALMGDYSYSLCKLVGPKGRVIAIEPQAEYARLLRAAALRLRLPMTVLECALSSRAGVAELCVPVVGGRKKSGFASLDHGSATARKSRVNLRRLDEVAAEVEGRISFLKVDVEGHELDVLKGGSETLKRHRPNLLIEIEQRHSPVPIAATFEFLREHNYTGHYLDQGARVPLAQFDPAANAELAGAGGPFEPNLPGYLFNFIFVPIPSK